MHVMTNAFIHGRSFFFFFVFDFLHDHFHATIDKTKISRWRVARLYIQPFLGQLSVQASEDPCKKLAFLCRWSFFYFLVGLV